MIWAWLGTLYLCLLTWEDYKKNMTVDDRKNYFMMGLSLALMMVVKRQWWYVITLVFVAVFISFLIKRFELVGEGDANAIMWSIYGFGILAPNVALMYFVIFASLTLLFELLKRIVFKTSEKMPFFGVILISFVVTCVFAGLYTFVL